MQPSAAPHAADVDEQQPAMAAGDSTATAGAAAVPSVKEEEAVAAVPQAQNAQHGMDIYADLGAQQVPGQAPQAAAVQPPEPRQQQPSAAGPPPAQGSLAASASGGTEPQQPAPIQQQDAASSGSLQALLSNPAALQALLKDPAQLQQLLQKHPQLISILKSTLGKQGG